jgi:hypothetical protein
MATGGASHLAASTGPHPLAAPLLWVAVAEAVAIPLLGIRQRSSVGGAIRCLVCSAPAARLFGTFTVPLGLAVVGGGLARGSGQVFPLACTAVILAWLTTLALLLAVVVPAALRPPGMATVDGAWFLAPAALLGDAGATASLLRDLRPAVPPGVHWLALIGCGVGVLGYGLVLGFAAGRLARVGLQGSTLSPWWISAGCGGLAAASIGQLATGTPAAGTTAAYCLAALLAWGLGSAALIPVLGKSLGYLWRLRSLQASPPWPPTFSTAVYALGALQVDRLCQLHFAGAVGRVAGLATVALWLATAALYVVLTSRRVRGRPS